MMHDLSDIPGELERLATRIRKGDFNPKAAAVVLDLEDRPVTLGFGKDVDAVKVAGMLSTGAENLTT